MDIECLTYSSRSHPQRELSAQKVNEEKMGLASGAIILKVWSSNLHLEKQGLDLGQVWEYMMPIGLLPMISIQLWLGHRDLDKQTHKKNMYKRLPIFFWFGLWISSIPWFQVCWIQGLLKSIPMDLLVNSMSTAFSRMWSSCENRLAAGSFLLTLIPKT